MSPLWHLEKTKKYLATIFDAVTCPNLRSTSQDGISKVYWREYKGCIPSISSCVEEFQNADQACFACLGELAGPLSTRYHQQHEEAASANPSNKPSPSAKGVSRLEDDILHLYIFSWSSESQEIQNAILDRYTAPVEPNTSHSGEQSPSRNLERT